jgi:hypothetical protein
MKGPELDAYYYRDHLVLLGPNVAGRPSRVFGAQARVALTPQFSVPWLPFQCQYNGLSSVSVTNLQMRNHSIEEGSRRLAVMVELSNYEKRKSARVL